MPKDTDIDLERCVTASIKQDDGHHQASTSSKPCRRCTVAVQHLDGCAVLINATIQQGVDGDFVFSSAGRQISQAFNDSWHQRLAGKLNLMGLIVGTARIKQIIHCGPQSPSPGHQGQPISPSRAYLQGFTLDPLLTESLRNPHLLLRSAAHLLNVDDFGSPPARLSNDVDSRCPVTCTGHNGREVIVVRRVIDRTKVAWLLTLLLFFSPALGIGVGICSHDADVGIAVSAGVFALASFLQGLVSWVQG